MKLDDLTQSQLKSLASKHGVKGISGKPKADVAKLIRKKVGGRVKMVKGEPTMTGVKGGVIEPQDLPAELQGHILSYVGRLPDGAEKVLPAVPNPPPKPTTATQSKKPNEGEYNFGARMDDFLPGGDDWPTGAMVMQESRDRGPGGRGLTVRLQELVKKINGKGTPEMDAHMAHWSENAYLASQGYAKEKEPEKKPPTKRGRKKKVTLEAEKPPAKKKALPSGDVIKEWGERNRMTANDKDAKEKPIKVRPGTTAEKLSPEKATLIDGAGSSPSWDDSSVGKFADQLTKYNETADKKLSMPEFADMILSGKYSTTTKRRANFYKNVLSKKKSSA